MIIKKINDIEIMKNFHGVNVRNLINKEEMVISVITLKPKESLKQHITPVDVVFYVLEGTGIVEIGDEKQQVDNGTLIESPKGIMHCWYNESEEPLQFLVIKAPRPTEKTVFIND